MQHPLTKHENAEVFVLSEDEQAILNALTAGETTVEISENRKMRKQKPSSKSHLEKTLKALRKRFAARTTIELIYILRHQLKRVSSKRTG